MVLDGRTLTAAEIHSGRQGRRQEFLSIGSRNSGVWVAAGLPQHPDKFTGSTRLPQVSQVDAGFLTSGPTKRRRPCGMVVN